MTYNTTHTHTHTHIHPKPHRKINNLLNPYFAPQVVNSTDPPSPKLICGALVENYQWRQTELKKELEAVQKDLQRGRGGKDERILQLKLQEVPKKSRFFNYMFR